MRGPRYLLLSRPREAWVVWGQKGERQRGPKLREGGDWGGPKGGQSERRKIEYNRKHPGPRPYRAAKAPFSITQSSPAVTRFEI